MIKIFAPQQAPHLLDHGWFSALALHLDLLSQRLNSILSNGVTPKELGLFHAQLTLGPIHSQAMLVEYGEQIGEVSHMLAETLAGNQ